VDALGTGYDDYTPEQRDQVIAAFPRGDDFKNEFIELQTRSALKKPTTTFGTQNNGWNSITKNSLLPGSLTSYLPGRESPRRCAIGRATC
jgi:hypothetical protein